MRGTSVEPSCLGQQWAGAATANTSGLYGTLGVPSPSNAPGGRRLGASWSDPQGRFWLFGGHGLDSTAAIGTLRDEWT